jgi:hypothetical protein
MIPILVLALEFGRTHPSDFEIVYVLIPLVASFVLWILVDAGDDLDARIGTSGGVV